MNIYHYNPDTGVYVGRGKADESPLEDNVWLIPANASVIEPPAYSELTEQAVYVGGSWIIQPIPEPQEESSPEPAPEPPAPGQDYVVFWEALLASSVYASIRTQASSDLAMNTAATEFIALLGDAKSGRPIEAAIQASIRHIIQTGTFTEDDLSELHACLVAGNLENIYSLV